MSETIASKCVKCGDEGPHKVIEHAARHVVFQCGHCEHKERIRIASYRIEPAELARMSKSAQASYRKGASVREIAREFDVSYGTAHRLLRGVQMRPRGGRAK